MGVAPHRSGPQARFILGLVRLLLLDVIVGALIKASAMTSASQGLACKFRTTSALP